MQVVQTNGLLGLERPARELESLPTRAIDARGFAALMARATWTPSDQPYLWKGGPLLLVELDSGRRLRFAASTYGGFVLQRWRQGSYEFADADRRAWEALVFQR